MPVFTIDEAQSRLPQLIEAAAQGELILITRTGQPIAKLTALPSVTAARRPGSMEERITIADDFDAELPPIVKSGFEQ